MSVEFTKEYRTDIALSNLQSAVEDNLRRGTRFASMDTFYAELIVEHIKYLEDIITALGAQVAGSAVRESNGYDVLMCRYEPTLAYWHCVGLIASTCSQPEPDWWDIPDTAADDVLQAKYYLHWRELLKDRPDQFSWVRILDQSESTTSHELGSLRFHSEKLSAKLQEQLKAVDSHGAGRSLAILKQATDIAARIMQTREEGQ